MTDVTGAVLVGYDGSQESAMAVEWAAVEASRRGEALVVLHAASFTQAVSKVIGRGEPASSPEGSSQVGADQGAELARRQVPDLQVRAMTDTRGAASALVDLSGRASLVVVGNRGRGRVAGGLLGSVAFALATHARSSVVVVRGDPARHHDRDLSVVVGVDGSGNLARRFFSEDQASRAGTELAILVAWQSVPANPWDRGDLANPDASSEASEQARQAANRIAEEAVEDAAGRHPNLAVVPAVGEGRPEELLVDASGEASLVVVGTRGRSDLASLLLGSVSRSVLHRAHCPVALVRSGYS